MASNVSVDSFVHRTLRTWAALNVSHAFIIASVALWIIPWKTAWVNAGLVVVALLQIAAGYGLWGSRRWAWRLAMAVSWLLVMAGLAVVAGLVMSWAYLKGIYGDFGYGTAIACLGIAMLVFQVLGIFSALQLRALLRRELRQHFQVKQSPSCAWWVAVSVLLLSVMWVYAGARMPTQPGLSRAARQASAEFIRASLQGESPLLKLSSKLGAIPLAQRTLYLTVWHQGVPLARFSATSYTLGEALGVLSRKIRARRHSIPNEVNVTLKFDFIVGRRQIRTFPKPLFALSLRPGIDGLRVSHAHSERAILPDDFIRADVYGAAPVVPGIAELRLGVDPDWALRQLKLEPHEQLERIRLQSWTINSTGTYLLSRGNSHGPHPSAEAFRKAALKGGEFVLRQITPEHTFHYVYLPYEDQYPSAAGYSIARHAGTVYSLLLLYQHSQQERFRQGAYDTLSWLMSIVNTPCLVAQGACVPEYGVASLGSAALSAIAALEYQRSTHDVQFEKQANALLEFIITMQTRDGDFRHFFSLQDQRVDLLGKTMFYSEEAALALVLGYKVFKNAAYLKAAERALDFLTQDKYRFFLGWFIYGADHWTCIAAQEAWPELKEPHYLEFCRGYAAFLRKLQYEPGEWDQDFVGHYGFSALLVPQAGAAAGFTEALISTYELGRYHGVYDARILRQIELGLSALLREQLRPDNSYLVKVPERALGGFRRSLVESDIRIDFTQHAMSALIRGAQLSYNKQSI